jgi:hypothetical protein
MAAVPHKLEVLERAARRAAIVIGVVAFVGLVTAIHHTSAICLADGSFKSDTFYKAVALRSLAYARPEQPTPVIQDVIRTDGAHEDMLRLVTRHPECCRMGVYKGSEDPPPDLVTRLTGMATKVVTVKVSERGSYRHIFMNNCGRVWSWD